MDHLPSVPLGALKLLGVHLLLKMWCPLLGLHLGPVLRHPLTLSSFLWLPHICPQVAKKGGKCTITTTTSLQHVKEMMKVESSQDSQARKSQERNPGVKHARVYEWEKTQSSGGREVYQQVKVNKKHNEDVYSFYKPYQWLYNAFANEWNLCEEFTIGKRMMRIRIRIRSMMLKTTTWTILLPSQCPLFLDWPFLLTSQNRD